MATVPRRAGAGDRPHPCPRHAVQQRASRAHRQPGGLHRRRPGACAAPGADVRASGGRTGTSRHRRRRAGGPDPAPVPLVHGGGQLHCNLVVDPDDTAAFAEDAGIGLCLDVSHSKLACTARGTSFAELVEVLGPHARHLHLVDAQGLDGEGLQVGDGDIDWPVLAEQLDRLAPRVGFIPEIWQGHKNDGEGFWVALDRLEQWF